MEKPCLIVINTFTVGKFMGMIDGIDKFIGAKIKMYRNMRGLNQKDLADTLDLNFQQIQKYEKGESKIRASKLLRAAKILNVPVECFFEGYDKIPLSGINDQAVLGLELEEVYRPYGDGSASEKEMVTLMLNFNRIRDKKKREMAIMFVASLVDEEGGSVSFSGSDDDSAESSDETINKSHRSTDSNKSGHKHITGKKKTK